MKRRCALSFVVVAVLLTGSGSAEEPRGEHDLIPNGLKSWSVEFYSRCREGDVKININCSGELRVQHFRVSQKSVLKLPAEDLDQLIESSRDFFNHYRARDDRIYNDCDVNNYFTFTSNNSPMVKIWMLPGELNVPMYRDLSKIDAILGKNGIKDASTFLRNPDPPAARPPQELIPPRVENPWRLWINQGNGPKSDAILFQATTAHFYTNSIETKIEYPTEIGEKTYDLARQFFNGYRLPIETDDASGVEEKYFLLTFTCRDSITVSCSRQMLIKMGLLDEFDALVADANRRLAEKDEKARFQAPWEE